VQTKLFPEIIGTFVLIEAITTVALVPEFVLAPTLNVNEYCASLLLGNASSFSAK